MSHVPVVFMDDERTGKGTVTNLSHSGCEIESSTRLLQRNYLALTLVVPEETDRVKVWLAAVRWATEGRAGLEFIALNGIEQARLARVLLTD